VRREPFVIEVALAALRDSNGEPNEEGIYLDALVPAMEMNTPHDGVTAWQANPHMTETQVTLGLLGTAHLEFTNGGREQLIHNAGKLALEIPEAFRRMGWQSAAELARAAITAAWEAQPAPRDLSRRILDMADPKGAFRREVADMYSGSPDPTAEAAENELGEFLQSRDFYDGVIAAVQSDRLGFRVTCS
jgi:hypothetical protein